jgi:hypothetical protein
MVVRDRVFRDSYSSVVLFVDVVDFRFELMSQRPDLAGY